MHGAVTNMDTEFTHPLGKYSIVIPPERENAKYS